MQDTGVKKLALDSAYQNKQVEVFPETEISSKSVPDLRPKNINEIFPADVTLRVIGIAEREIGGGKKETFYRLEIRQLGVKQKNPEDMEPEEILAKIEEEQVK